MEAPSVKEIAKSVFRTWLSTFVFSPAALLLIGIMYFGNFNALGASEILASLDGKIVEIWFFLGWTVFAAKFVFLYLRYAPAEAVGQDKITPTDIQH